MVCVIIEEVVDEASVELAAAESVEVMEEESVVSWARTREVAPRRSSRRSMLTLDSSRTSGKIKRKGSTSDDCDGSDSQQREKKGKKGPEIARSGDQPRALEDFELGRATWTVCGGLACLVQVAAKKGSGKRQP
jgi:hypothetical protein